MKRRSFLASRGLTLACTLALAIPLHAGCGGSSLSSNSGHAETRAVCNALDPLMALETALQDDADFGASSQLGFLVDADNELAAMDNALEALKGSPSTEVHALDEQIRKLKAASETRRGHLAEQIANLAKTYAEAEAALNAAAICQNVDLRGPSTRVPAIAGRSTDDAAQGKANRAVIASPVCEAAVRLWTAASEADLMREVSSSSVAAHLKELSLTGERVAIRDRLVTALKAHAQVLGRLQALGDPSRSNISNDLKELVAVRYQVVASLTKINPTCVQNLQDSNRVIGGKPSPRRVTVTVRPKWSGSLAKLPHPEEFGSGFVVRWRAPSGQVETRIVTNNHVMDGAFEAEIAASDDANAKSDTWTATLIHSDPYDDVAVLRLTSSAPIFNEGLAFRLTPAREQEQVIAAGFPGIGARPSFQVSKGTVSNASFGAEGPNANPMQAYVQHTAPIDPGNSGGPLLDAAGNLLGMNTLKIVRRENVGLAIPTPRIQLALLRTERAPVFNLRQAEANCNAVVAALSSSNPVAPAMSRFGLPLYEWTESQQPSVDEAGYRQRVRGEPENAADLARFRAYGSIRARVEHEGGVKPFEVCSDVRSGKKRGSFVGVFRTRGGAHELSFAEEHGVLRLVAFR